MFQQAFIPTRMDEVMHFERDHKDAQAGEDLEDRGVFYQTLMGLKPDMSGPKQQPTILDQSTGVPPAPLSTGAGAAATAAALLQQDAAKGGEGMSPGDGAGERGGEGGDSEDEEDSLAGSEDDEYVPSEDDGLTPDERKQRDKDARKVGRLCPRRLAKTVSAAVCSGPPV